MSKGKFALGALIGATAGIVAGVLTAPKSGKETRADLKEKAGELKNQASEKVNEASKQVDKAAHSAREVVDDYGDRASRALDSAKTEFHKESKK